MAKTKPTEVVVLDAATAVTVLQLLAELEGQVEDDMRRSDPIDAAWRWGATLLEAAGSAEEAIIDAMAQGGIDLETWTGG